MTDERPNESYSPDGDNGKNALSTLESAQGYVAASTAASRAGDGGCKEFSASFHALMEWGEATESIVQIEDLPFIHRPTDGHGDEHEGWFDVGSNRWYKLTYENRFGVAWGHEGTATAEEYLTRLILQNRFFGDDIQLIGLLNSRQRLRVLTSQPHIAGEAASHGEIRHWFESLGFKRFESDNCVAWYRESDNLLVSDAHEGNVIRSNDGILFAIDVNPKIPNEEMRLVVMELLNKFSG